MKTYTHYLCYQNGEWGRRPFTSSQARRYPAMVWDNGFSATDAQKLFDIWNSEFQQFTGTAQGYKLVEPFVPDGYYITSIHCVVDNDTSYAVVKGTLVDSQGNVCLADTSLTNIKHYLLHEFRESRQT